MKEIVIFSILFLSFTASLSQTTNDEHRGLYLDYFAKSIPGQSSVYDPIFSVLGADENKDGIFEKEDALLRYASENHITYLTCYDMNRILGTSTTCWNENTKRYEKLEEHFCRFSTKAKNEYCITQIGVAAGGPRTYDSVFTYLERWPLTERFEPKDPSVRHPHVMEAIQFANDDHTGDEVKQQAAERIKFFLRATEFNACNRCEADIDVLNTEFEFWGDCSNLIDDYITLVDRLDFIKQQYNALHPNNPIISEAYLSFLGNCTTPLTKQQVVQYMDGCKNCAPCSSCSNPHTRKIDRSLQTFLSPNPLFYTGFGDVTSFEDSTTEDSSDVHALLYSTSAAGGSTFDYLGYWFPQSPNNTIFYAEELWHDYWNQSGTAHGQARQNIVKAGAAQWFAQSQMVGILDNPLIFASNSPTCLSTPANLSFTYWGPEDYGMHYEFSITRDSDSSVIYPTSGISISGLTNEYIPVAVGTPRVKVINFADTAIFPVFTVPVDVACTANLILQYGDGTCSYHATVPLYNAPRPKIIALNKTATCEGGNVWLKADAGANAYQWYKDGVLLYNQTARNYSATTAGYYYCNISTNGVCNGFSDSIYVDIKPNPNALINVTCLGANQFRLNVLDSLAATSFGPGGVTYLWNNGATTSSISVTATTNTRYRCYITNPFNGCTQEVSVNIPGGTTAYSVATSINRQPSSACAQDGVIGLTINPAPAAGVAYLWSTGQTTSTLSGVGSGIYSVVATIGNSGCSLRDTAIIGAPMSNMPQVIPTIINASCSNSNNGGINLQVTGGIGPFKFHWPGLGIENNRNPYDANQSSLFPGIYNVWIIDANGCKYPYSFTITTNNNPLTASFSGINPVSGCANNNTGAATINVTGGTTPYDYLWSSGSNSNSSSTLAAGTNEVLVTDANGCNENFTVQIPASNLPLTLLTLNDSNFETTCGANTGSIKVCIKGGKEPYQINTPWQLDSLNHVSLDSLIPGTYQLIVTDSIGCTISNTYSILPSNIFNYQTTATNVDCYNICNGIAAIHIQGGSAPFTINFNGSVSGDTIYNGLCSGLNFYSITDVTGCSVNDSIFIDAPDSLSMDFSTTVSSCINCNDGSIQITTSGGLPPYNFSWLPNVSTSADADSLLTGTYAVCITDSVGCIFCDSVFVDFFPLGSNNIINESIQVYPNPFLNKINISTSKQIDNLIAVRIVNCLGQEIFQGSNLILPYQISLDHIKPGAYWLQINNGMVITNSKLIKLTE